MKWNEIAPVIVCAFYEFEIKTIIPCVDLLGIYTVYALTDTISNPHIEFTHRIQGGDKIN